MQCSDLRKRYEAQKSQRYIVENTWNVIERFVVPFRGEMYKTDEMESEVDWRKREIFDSTAVDACQVLAASIHGSVTTPMVKWFNLRFRLEKLNEDKEGAVWLRECESRIFFALQESNFDLEVNEAYIDICSFGTAVVVEEVDFEKDMTFDQLNFTAVPIKECFFEADDRGGIRYFYRRLKWTAVQVVSKFGKDNVPDWIVEKAESAAEPDNRIEIVMAIYPREDMEDVDTSKPLAPEKRPWGMKYFCAKNAERIGEEKGYYEMPAFIIKWRKVSGSQWGHSPAMVALANITTLNQLVEIILKSAEKAVDPPVVSTERGLLSDLDLEAAGLTYVREMDQLQPFNSGARFDVGQLQRETLQADIRRTFLADQIEPLGARSSTPQMTATEVERRWEWAQKTLGPTLGRLQSDFLDPMIQRTFNILYREGMLPPPPQVVVDAGAEMDIEYLGPLSRSQKMAEASAVERWVQGTAALAEVFPEALDIPDVDAAVRQLAEYLGIPPALQKSADEVDQIRAQRAQQQQIQQQIALATAGGQAAKSMGEGMQAIDQSGGIPLEATG